MPINKKCVKSFPIWGMTYNETNNSMLMECKKKKKQIHSKNELIYKTEIESQMQKTNLWLLGGNWTGEE